jgi:hypothetical protein
MFVWFLFGFVLGLDEMAEPETWSFALEIPDNHPVDKLTSAPPYAKPAN